MIFVHNHPNGPGASAADLESAFAAGAALLLVITGDGREGVYLRGRDRMALVRDGQASYEVGSPMLNETIALAKKSAEEARRYREDPPELVFRQAEPGAIANIDVNPDRVAGYNELKHFVNTKIDQLTGLSREEILIEMVQAMDLIEGIFGYTVQFHDTYDHGANAESAMKQVHNLGTILFHYLNDLGISVMRSSPDETKYLLGADERLRELHNVDDYAYRGHVALADSTAAGSPDLKIVYLGSAIEAGTIGHEVAHEIDRRAGGLSSVSERDEPPPEGSLEWFLWNKVKNRLQPTGQYGYNFRMAASYLRPGSRAARTQDYDFDREIFADILPAKILGSLDERYFSRADIDAAIGFLATRNAKDVVCGIEQYYDQYAEYLEHGTPEPKDFVYDPEFCE